MTGPYSMQYWFLMACNIVAPNFLWFRKVRCSPVLLFISSIVVLVGMWLERYMIIVSSLAQDNLPSSWGLFHATRWDWATYLRHHRAVPVPVLPVYPSAAHDFDL